MLYTLVDYAIWNNRENTDSYSKKMDKSNHIKF